MRPRVGIPCSTTRCDDRVVEAVEKAYIDAVRAAGGIPFVLPILEPADADDVLDTVDGLVLAGGVDVDPSCYGELAEPEVTVTDPRRDRYETALVRRAARRKLPVLGVCRGLQIANVARGGTLVQHLPAVSTIDHRDDARSYDAVHPVVVESGSWFGEIVDATVLDVNSLHHQAVRRVGSGLSVAARAFDGTVEALVADDRGFVGVQWHPELLAATSASRRLFGWLVEAAAVGARPVPVSLTSVDGGRAAVGTTNLADAVA